MNLEDERGAFPAQDKFPSNKQLDNLSNEALSFCVAYRKRQGCSLKLEAAHRAASKINFSLLSSTG